MGSIARGNAPAWFRLAAVAAVAWPLGCAAPQTVSSTPPAPVQTQSPVASKSNDAGQAAAPADPLNDPCAAHLHEICAPLLLFYERNQRLPEQIAELQTVQGFQNLPMKCPVSGEAYEYDPKGTPVRGPGWLAIIRDGRPHAGQRWAIAIREPMPGQPLVTDVVSIGGRR